MLRLDWGSLCSSLASYPNPCRKIRCIDKIQSDELMGNPNPVNYHNSKDSLTEGARRIKCF
jgi:hypothetical protein